MRDGARVLVGFTLGEACGFDPGHDLVHLGFGKLVNELEMTAEETPALANFADYPKNRLRYLRLALVILLATEAEPNMYQLEHQILATARQRQCAPR